MSDIVLYVFGALSITSWAMYFGICLEENLQHNKAVAAGVGEYYLDARNTKQFRYTAHPTQKAEHE